jgi:hypothetical protein
MHVSKVMTVRGGGASLAFSYQPNIFEKTKCLYGRIKHYGLQLIPEIPDYKEGVYPNL